MTTTPPASSRYQCIICTFVAKESSKLRTHIEGDHSRQSNFWCKWCGKWSECLDEFFEHLENELCGEAYDHPCGVEGCDFSNKDPSRFVVHIKTVHRGTPLVPCKYCKRLFTMPPCLVLHLQSECCNRPQAKQSSISKVKSEPFVSHIQSEIKITNAVPKPKPKPKPNQKKINPKNDKLACKVKPPKSKRKKKVNKGRAKRQKYDNLFETHSDSDVDDPTWRFEEDANEKRRKPSRKMEIYCDQSSDESVKLKNESMSEDETNEKCILSGQPNTNLNLSNDQANDEMNDQSSNGSVELRLSSEDEEVSLQTYKSWNEWQMKIQELKSKNALNNLLKEENIINFYKCMHKSCSYSSETEMDFVMHLLSSDHEKVHRCCYCFLTFNFVEKFTDHMVRHHSERRYQCSACLYRSSSKGHAKLHLKEAHNSEDSVEIITCPKLEKNESDFKPVNNVVIRNRYKCVNTCKFNCLDADVLAKHLEEEHRDVTNYQCSLCTFKSSDMLPFLQHFGKHDVFSFECFYCLFGSEQSADVMTHMNVNHVDLKMQVLSRSNSRLKNENGTTETFITHEIKKEPDESGSSKQNNDSSSSLPQEKSCKSANNKTVSSGTDCNDKTRIKETLPEKTVIKEDFSNNGQKSQVLNLENVYYYANNVKMWAREFPTNNFTLAICNANEFLCRK